MRGEVQEDMAVCFEDVKFIRATNVPKDSDINFTIMIQKGTGNFEIIESEAAVVTGRISFVENSAKEFLPLEPLKATVGDDMVTLSAHDVYKELRLRGYNYQGEFKGIIECDISGQVAKIEWNSNWTAFMDSLLQLQIIDEDVRGLFVPTSIQKMIIDPKRHCEFASQSNRPKNAFEDTEEVLRTIESYYYKDLGVLKAGGIEIRGLKANPIQRRKPLGEAVVERQVFIPYKYHETLSVSMVATIIIVTGRGIHNISSCACRKPMH